MMADQEILKKIDEKFDMMEVKLQNSVSMQIKSMVSNLQGRIQNAVTEEIKNLVDGLSKQLNDFKDTLNFFSAKCEDLAKVNIKMGKEIKDLKQENLEKSREIISLKKHCQENSASISEIDNYLRLNNVEVHGVSLGPNDDPKIAVTKVLKVVDDKIQSNDIEFCYVKESKGKDPTVSRPILVKLKSKEKRMVIFKEKKRLAGFDFKNIGVRADKVFINENLSSFSKQLFFKANALKKKFGWKFIWTLNGQIRLRKSSDSQLLIVRNDADLDKIN